MRKKYKEAFQGVLFEIMGKLNLVLIVVLVLESKGSYFNQYHDRVGGRGRLNECRQVTLLPMTTFLHMKVALTCKSFKSASH